jgi:hypothetical protein
MQYTISTLPYPAQCVCKYMLSVYPLYDTIQSTPVNRDCTCTSIAMYPHPHLILVPDTMTKSSSTFPMRIVTPQTPPNILKSKRLPLCIKDKNICLYVYVCVCVFPWRMHRPNLESQGRKTDGRDRRKPIGWDDINDINRFAPREIRRYGYSVRWRRSLWRWWR